MFFSLSKLLVLFTDPLFFILLLTLVGVLKLKKKRTFLLLFCAFYILSIPFASQRMLFFLEHLEVSTVSNPITYDAVIVLTGMVNLEISTPDKIEFSDAVDRILVGTEWVKNNKATHLIISGGSGALFENQKSEAVILGSFAQKLGVLENRILLDTSSKNTFQNAVNTSALIREKQFNRVALITSAFHMFRANGCFKEMGIHADLLPVDFSSNPEVTDFRDFLPSTAALSQSNRFIHESIGILVYGLTGKAKLL
jgi:uncharacterized SAM-binding protein YcdF (DUF218 family)